MKKKNSASQREMSDHYLCNRTYMIAARLFYLPLILAWLLPGIFLASNAQDTLPQFSVKDIGKDRYVISWVNNYPYTAQITIQRSFDSIRGYKSILTVPDPNAKQNGYADSKAINDHMFYRLYIQLENGRFLFTAAKQPSREIIITEPQPKPVLTTSPTVPQKKEELAPKQGSSTTPAPVAVAINAENNPANITTDEKTTAQVEPTTENTATREIPAVKRVEPIIVRLQNVRLGDSAKTPLAVTTKDDPNAYAPSLFVYTHPDGNIRIQVPNRARLSKYRLKFFESDKRFLFELRNLPAPNFQLDKINFLHGGWFLFELYEDTRLIEKHKLHLDR
ncbi:MAG: hypothetical protein ACK5BU_06055 [Bacteroidota bacterium]